MYEAHRIAAHLAAQIASTVTERARVYGAPEKNFAAIADFWNGWLSARHGIEVNLDATDVGMMSALIKVARLAQTPGHEDSALDAATYLLLGHGCVPAASEGDAPALKKSSPPPNHPFPKVR